MDADKLDKQLENYWTKHGKINKIDSNIWCFFFLFNHIELIESETLNKQLEGYWKSKPDSGKGE